MRSRSVTMVCKSVHHGTRGKVADAIASATDVVLCESGAGALEGARDGALLGPGAGTFFGSRHKDQRPDSLR
jgi:hypothetical protein